MLALSGSKPNLMQSSWTGTHFLSNPPTKGYTPHPIAEYSASSLLWESHMPQRTVTLIRHGQRIPEGEDPPLTQLGRKQAAMTADLFKGHDIKTIYYSTMRRSRETAEIIAHQLPSASLIGYESLWECVPTIPPQFSKLFQDQARENPDYRSFNIRNAQLRLDDVCSEIFTPAVDCDVHDWKRHTLSYLSGIEYRSSCLGAASSPG
jgi:hypothetical protein